MNRNPKNIIRLLLIILSVVSGFFAYGYSDNYLASINRDVLTGVNQSGALERVYDESSIKASMEITKIFRDETNTFAANRARETDEAKTPF